MHTNMDSKNSVWLIVGIILAVLAIGAYFMVTGTPLAFQ